MFTILGIDCVRICICVNILGSGNRASEPPNSQRRANPRQISCLNCRQTGHSSHTCPLQGSNSTPQPSRGQNSQNGILLDFHVKGISIYIIHIWSQWTYPNLISIGFAFLLSLGNSPVLCGSCEAPCVMRTANTEANRGRRFYTCQSQGCGFFMYAKQTYSFKYHVYTI